MKKILYCILHTKNHEERYNNVIETWGKNVDLLFISDHQDLDKKIIKVTDNSSYNSGQEKQIKGFNHLMESKLDYDFYFFCDNDCFVNTKLMNEFIGECDTNSVWGQLCTCWPTDRTLNYTLGGAGILVSKEIFLKIENKLQEYNVMWGDVSLGLNLRKRNIPMSHSDLFLSQPPSHYGIEDNNIKNYITFHYIKKREEMEKMNNLCL